MADVKAKLMATREDRDKSHIFWGGGLHQEKVLSVKYDLGLLPYMVFQCNAIFHSPAHDLPVLFSLLTL